MSRIFSRLLLVSALLYLIPGTATSAPVGDCSSEPTLAGRSDVIMCEPWEQSDWYARNGYTPTGGLPPFRTVDAEQHMEYASLETVGCKQGKCLKLFAKQGVTRQLNIHWPLAEAGVAPDEAYFRYYIKLGPNWNAKACDANTGDEVWPPGGKFPGFADARDFEDPGGQCGNGGAKSDGIQCWSARGLFRGCNDVTSLNGFPYDNTCDTVPGAVTRIGSYLYVPDTSSSHGANGLWDSIAEDQNLGADYTSSCRRSISDNPSSSCYCQSTNNMYCGLDSGGILQGNRWYAVETYVKMNTPGVADGVIRGWVDGVLSYEKTNMMFRKVGHDNLHVRTVWLNVFKGGTDGNCSDSYIYLDQMVVASSPIGVINSSQDTIAPNPPENLSAD